MTENTKKPLPKISKQEQEVIDYIDALSKLSVFNENMIDLAGKMRQKTFNLLQSDITFNNLFVNNLQMLTAVLQVMAIEANRNQFDMSKAIEEIESLKGAYYKKAKT